MKALLRISAICTLAIGALGACSAGSQPQHESTSHNEAGEIQLQIDTENQAVDEHLRAALRNLNEQFTVPFPNSEYLPRTAEELEKGSSAWVYDLGATQALGNEDLVFKIGENESVAYSTANQYNNLTLRWYCSWVTPLTEAMKQQDKNELMSLRVRIEKDDPATASTPLAKAVDPSIAQYAHTLRDAANESDLSSLSTMCAPLKIQRDR